LWNFSFSASFVLGMSRDAIPERKEVMNMDDVKAITDIAKLVFLKDGYHAPLIFVKGSDNKAAIQLARFGATAGERELDMLNAGTWLACKHNVGELELIVFVDEAWMGTNLHVRPSQDPKRIEVLLINSLDARTQEEKLFPFEVKRDPKGKVLDLKEMVLPEAVETKGILLPAFQKGYQIVSPVHN
jgi:hypothetical protein